MEREYPEYVTKEAVDSLTQKLDLPKNDGFSQDWEYEVSDSSKVEEFLYSYENLGLNKDEKYALMTIIISSYNDAIEEGTMDERTKEKIKFLLLSEVDIHRNIILNWAMLDEEDIENCYAIAPFMREVAKAANLVG